MEMSIFDLVSALSVAVDLVSTQVNRHNMRVGYISHSIARELDLPEIDIAELVLAGMLHDIGGLSLQQRLDALAFDSEDNLHGEAGQRLLASFKPFQNIAEVVRVHHNHWPIMGEHLTERLHLLQAILFLADRIDVMIEPEKSIFPQTDRIMAKLQITSHWFHPDALRAFLAIGRREDFWLTLSSGDYDQVLQEDVDWKFLRMDSGDLDALFSLFSKVIDFRSPFTATHSAGVSVCGESLAKTMGFDATDAAKMRHAGLIHDLGKLAVPVEVLDNPNHLTIGDYDLIRSHSFLTGKVLKNMKGYDEIRNWAAQHHERMDGTGYPYHLNESKLSPGSRILAVTDVFVALTEDRPYRSGLSWIETNAVLHRMAMDNHLDAGVVYALENHGDALNRLREEAQQNSMQQYKEFTKGL